MNNSHKNSNQMTNHVADAFKYASQRASDDALIDALTMGPAALQSVVVNDDASVACRANIRQLRKMWQHGINYGSSVTTFVRSVGKSPRAMTIQAMLRNQGE